MQRNWSKSVINYLWGRGGRVSYGDGVYYTWHYNARIYSSTREYDLRRDRAPRTKREVYTFLTGQHTSLHDKVQSYLKNIAMTEPLLDGGGNIIGAESSDNDQMGYNKAKSKASKPSSWVSSIVNRVKGSTESPALLTSEGHDSTTVTVVPEINTTLVNNTIILGILAAGLSNKTQYRQPIHENLLSPREQSMKLNNVDEDRIKKAILQGAERFGNPDTHLYEAEISGNKTGMGRK